MTIFDLLFIAVLLASVGTVIAAAIAGIRGQAARAFRLLRIFGICAALYMLTATAVHFLLPLRVLSIGDAQCSDDWCITVESVKRPPAAGAEIYYDVNFRISSSAHRVVQREKGLTTYLIDGRGRRSIRPPRCRMFHWTSCLNRIRPLLPYARSESRPMRTS